MFAVAFIGVFFYRYISYFKIFMSKYNQFFGAGGAYWSNSRN